MLTFLTAVSRLAGIVPGWLWVSICLSLLGTAGTLGYRLNALQADVAEERLETSKRVVVQLKQASAETLRLQGVIDEGSAQAQRNRDTNATLAAAARRELDGVRRNLAANRSGMPGDTLAAAAARADTRGAVFEACAAEYLDVARAAGGHLEDALEHHTTWPVVKNFDEAVTLSQRLINYNKKEAP